MSCSRCGSWNLRDCHCPPRVKTITHIVESPCTGCTTQVDGGCVFYKSTTTPCLGIKFGDTYDSIVKKIDLAICTSTQNCNTWTNITKFINGWTSLGVPFQTAQYSNKVGCTVKLRGTLRNESFPSSSLDIAALPVGSRPAAWRLFSVNVAVGVADLVPCQLIITDTGIMTITGNIPNESDAVFSLDGISFEV